MESMVKEDFNAVRQLPKLKLLLKKYRHLKTMQSGLLQLSELASTVTDMEAFYPSLVSIIQSLLISDSFHIALVDKDKQLTLAFSHNPKEINVQRYFEERHWSESLTHLVYQEREALHCSASERAVLAKAGKVAPAITTCVDWLGVPLKRGHHIIGVIALQSYDKNLYFDDRGCQLLQFIAEHLVTAIDRVSSRELLEHSIQQRTKKLTEINEKLQQEIAQRQKAVKMHKALLALSEITATSKNIEDFYQALHREVNDLVNAENFTIALMGKPKQPFEFPYCVNEGITQTNLVESPDYLTELAIQTSKPLLIASGKLTTLTDQGQLSTQPFVYKNKNKKRPRAWLSAPLIDQGKVFGVLVIQDYKLDDAYQESDLELIRFVGEHIASAILRKRALEKDQQAKDELERLVNARTEELLSTNLNLRMQIEERRKAEAQLYHDAHHDALTKLPNRAMFSDRLTYAIKHLKRHSNKAFAVLFIDLDRFKMINDTLGHHAGDLFLIEIASRLKCCVRDNDVLARLGGDEFVVLLDSLHSQDDVEDVASRIIEAISQPFDIDGNSLHSNASIGIAIGNQQYLNANEILRDADAAMYQAKSLGRGRYVFFDDSMREHLVASMTLEQELRVAIKEKQFELHYQEISDLHCTKSIGFEALLRWQHPTKGLLTPSEFLFMAEETGIILDIETWIFEEVSEQLLSWQLTKEHSNAYIAINLSGRNLIQANQLAKLTRLIEKHGIEPQRIILEFNELAFMQHPDIALKGLRKLKEFGVKLALDDYGAGLSSLNYLHNYPFEFIKLDRSFVQTLGSNEKNLSLVKALHELGNQFGYRLVAEGIETEETLNKLHSVGCDFGQGYHISRPRKIKRIVKIDSKKDCA